MRQSGAERQLFATMDYSKIRNYLMNLMDEIPDDQFSCLNAFTPHNVVIPHALDEW